MKSHRILVVEDEEGIRRLVQKVLSDAGYEVVTARDGEEGLLCLEAETFDLVITDLALPKISGLEVIRATRYKRWPVIAMSAHWGNSPLLSQAERYGAAILGKPFDRAQLLSLVAQQLSP